PKKIYLSSLYPFVSQWTVKEIDLGDIEIVETYTKDFETICCLVDEVVVGGGPLMDIEPLNHILYAFMQAAKYGKIARIEGCGVGPLLNPLYIDVVSEIFRLADHITVRDSASARRAETDFGRKDIAVVPDPATNYVVNVKGSDRLRLPSDETTDTKKVACFLRKLTLEYKGDLDGESFDSLQQRFEAQLVQMLMYVSNSYHLELNLLPMHTFSVGGDDRKFNRKIVRDLETAEGGGEPSKASYERGILSPLEILQAMHHARFNICMRFHSVLFAQTLGVPYLAIDYTSGGKIEAYLRDRNELNRLMTLEDIAQGRWKEKVDDCLAEGLLMLS
ncbi:MAG: polysaccharide pyruvyl transferase family protein, partial [Cyanobacteria bacterium P01_D01_bin.56]